MLNIVLGKKSENIVKILRKDYIFSAERLMLTTK